MRNKLISSFLIAINFILITACSKKQDTTSTQNQTPEDTNKRIVITFTYGSEKKHWIEKATNQFNNQKHKSSDGRHIHVHQIPMGSGECIREVNQGSRKVHIISPASEAFIKLGNAESQSKTNTNLVNNTQNLCLSPVVIAMWEPMAQALGHGKKSIGWKEIHNMAQDPNGWATHNKPQWGQFRFGHTHPDFSNSGLISLIAEVYASTNKQRNLTLNDIQDPKVGKYLEEIEQSIVHYGKSTGFFGRKMFNSGPEYLSAAVLYESMVIESRKKTDLPFPVVAIYPREGTFWSDHPAGIVNREWVTDEHKQAAQTYLDFLLTKDQQTKVMDFGFRPGDVTIPLNDTFSEKNGVDANQPKTTLEVPEVPIISEIRKLWFKHKKKAHICLALDVSGSMNENNKIKSAKEGAKKLVQTLSPDDSFSLITFSTKPIWILKNANIGKNKEQIIREINSLYASGGTALYDSVSAGFNHFQANPEPKKITSIVVLSDGEDTKSNKKLNILIPQITSNNEGKNTRVFTIGYGKGAKMKTLKRIAESTKAKAFKGNTKDIEKIFLEISTFF